MSQYIEIKLVLNIALPALDLIQEQAAALRANPEIRLNGNAVTQADLADLHCLLDLFDPYFRDTGTIAIGEPMTPAVVRACSLLRLRLRQSDLSAIPDEKLRAGMDPKLEHGANAGELMGYLFLGTLQEILLQNFAHLFTKPVADDASSGEGFQIWLRAFFGKLFPARNGTSTASSVLDSSAMWRVIVLDDPVNSMTYVTRVFQRVLRLDEAAARSRMQEVHNLGQSVVWEDAREAAERHLHELHGWHLNAVLETGEDPDMLKFSSGP